MPLDATTVKLSESDKQMIEAIKAKQGIETMVEVFRWAMTYALLNAPEKKKKKKVSSWG